MDAIQLMRVLETFNERAERVFHSKFNLEILPRTDINRLTVGPDGIVTSPGIRDFRIELDAFVLTYRLFFQNNEPFSIANISVAYQSSLIPQEMRESLRTTREHHNRFLDASLITTWQGGARTFRELHDIVIYGELAHVNEKKANKFKTWDQDTLTSHAMWSQFAIAVSFSISVIDHIQSLNCIVIRNLK
jgi:hypothetical protein